MYYKNPIYGRAYLSLKRDNFIIIDENNYLNFKFKRMFGLRRQYVIFVDDNGLECNQSLDSIKYIRLRPGEDNFQSKIKVENFVGNLLDNNYLKIDSKLKKEYDVQFYSWDWYNDNIFIERTPKNIQEIYKENFFKNSISLIDSCTDQDIKKMFYHAEKKGYSNPTDIYEAFGVETITTENLLEDYDEIMECENLQWKVINESYDNQNWQIENIMFENLK
jgi:hypothetical protein